MMKIMNRATEEDDPWQSQPLIEMRMTYIHNSNQALALTIQGCNHHLLHITNSTALDTST